MNVLLLGGGPIAAFLTWILEARTSVTWATDGAVRPSAPAHGTTARLGATAKPVTAPRPLGTVDQDETWDAIVIAEPPALAMETLAALRDRFELDGCEVALSCNGYWWRSASRHGFPVSALSVTSRVVQESAGLWAYGPPTSGVIVGPPGEWSDEVARCVKDRGLGMSITDTAACAVLSKFVVNSPLSLQWALRGPDLQDALRQDDQLEIEAHQVRELAALAQRLGHGMADAPGFDVRRLQRCADEWTPRSTAAAAFADVLSTWRQGRVPTLGDRLWRRHHRAAEEADQAWGELLREARRVDVAMPTTESLYAQVLRRLRSGRG